MNRVARQTSFTMLLGDSVGQSGSEGSVSVGHLTVDRNRDAALDSRLGLVDKLVVETLIHLVILRLHSVGGGAGTHLERWLEHQGEVEVGGLGSSQGLVDFEEVRSPDHLFDRSQPELGHDLSQFIGNVEAEVDDVLRLTSEFGPQFRRLCGDTDRAGSEMALSHHDTSERNQRGGCETPFYGLQWSNQLTWLVEAIRVSLLTFGT
jgi:hypothetical protein